MIELAGVTKRFGATPAVDDVSLTVPRGTTHVLLGSSGCGKSTILRLVLGVISPDAGTVAVDGVVVTPETRARVVEQIGYVVQTGGLFPHLTAARNVTLPSEARRWPSERMRTRLDEPLGALDPIVRADLQRELREIFSRLGKTVVMVTHDVAEAALFGTTIALMTGGRVVQQGTFEDLARRPADDFVREFLVAQAPPPEIAAYLRR